MRLHLFTFVLLVLSFVPPSNSHAGRNKEEKETAISVAAECQEKLVRGEDPYRYADYNGPQNAVLEKIRNTSPAQRNPRYSTVAAKGKVFQWQELMHLMGVNFEGRTGRLDAHWLQVFVNAEDPMTTVTTRAKFVKGSYTYSDPLIRKWVYEQYPELIEPVKKWRTEAGDKNNQIGATPSADNVAQWLKSHPEYKNGVLIFPRPTLWNKISAANKNLSRAVLDGSREFFIEDIAALFSTKQSEARFHKLHSLLISLLGPYSARLTQAGVIEQIAKWTLTQYPELKELANNPEAEVSIDALSERFGRTLGVIPVAWVGGDMRNLVMPHDLEQLPEQWLQTVLPCLTSFVRGDRKPNLEPKKFLLKDPVTFKRRELQAGDDVELLFLPLGAISGDKSFMEQHAVYGTVYSLISNETGGVVGVQLRPWETSGYLPKRVGTKNEIVTFWMNDFDAEDSSILQSGNMSNTPIVPFESLSFPKNTGEFMIPVGKGGLQAPISIGDAVHLVLHNGYKAAEYEHNSFYVDMFVTDIPLDSEGKATGLTGYVDTHFNFQHAVGLNRLEDGTPVSYEKVEGSGENRHQVTINLKESSKIKTFSWSELKRGSYDGTNFRPNYTESNKKKFTLPASFIRKSYDQLRTWGKSESTAFSLNEDSGEFMLPIGREQKFFGASRAGVKVEQAPLSPGDEVLIHVTTPDTLLGFQYDRVLISSIIFQNQKAVGFRGENSGASGKDQEWFFSQINKEDSYIETAPWFGSRANQVPGAYAKRLAYEVSKTHNVADFFKDIFDKFKNSGKKETQENPEGPMEDLFGYKHSWAVKVEPWTTYPVLYDSWLEVNKIAKQIGVDQTWAYWVFQTSAETNREDLTKIFRKLSLKFHPDRNPGNLKAEEAFKAVTAAWTILQKYHR